MQINTAISAGTLAVEISTVTAQIAAVNNLINNNAYIGSGTLVVADPTAGNIYQTVNQLTVSESNTVFTAMLSVLNARLSSWQTALAAM